MKSRFIKTVLLVIAITIALALVLSTAPKVHGESPSGPAFPEIYRFNQDSKQPQVCNDCLFTGPAVVVHMTPQTTIPLYVRFTSTYISQAKGLKLYDVYTEGCVEILNNVVGVNGYEVNAKITCKPANGNIIVAVRYQPLKIGVIPIDVEYADSGNWDLISKKSITIKVKEDPWINAVVPSAIVPGQIFAIDGGFDELGDEVKVAFRAPSNYLPAELGKVISVTHSRIVVEAPGEFRLPWQWNWSIFVLFKEYEEGDLDWRMSNWVPVTLLGEKSHLPILLR